MSLKIESIGGFNPFDFIKCPLCQQDEFTSIDHASVWCDECNSSFIVRHTSGDPGCVVDFSMISSHIPKQWLIDGFKFDCEFLSVLKENEIKTFMAIKYLVQNYDKKFLFPSKEYENKWEMSQTWQNFKDNFYLYRVLKLGGTDSGWINHNQNGERWSIKSNKADWWM